MDVFREIWSNPPRYLGQGQYIVQRGASGGDRGGHATLGRGPTPSRAQLWRGCLVWPLRLPFWLRGSSGEIWRSQLFSEFFSKVDFSAQKEDTRAILLKTALVHVSCIQIIQVRGKTTAKVFGKVDTFWTYQLPPSLAYCLSSSNSVDKLNAIKKLLRTQLLYMMYTYLNYDYTY